MLGALNRLPRLLFAIFPYSSSGARPQGEARITLRYLYGCRVDTVWHDHAVLGGAEVGLHALASHDDTGHTGTQRNTILKT